MPTSDVLLHDTWCVLTFLSVFVSWLFLLAVMIDNSTIPNARRPHMLTLMAFYTFPIPVTIVTLALVVMWR